MSYFSRIVSGISNITGFNSLPPHLLRRLLPDEVKVKKAEYSEISCSPVMTSAITLKLLGAVESFSAKLPPEIKMKLDEKVPKSVASRMIAKRPFDIVVDGKSHHSILSDFEGELTARFTQILGHIIDYRDAHLSAMPRADFVLFTRELFNLESLLKSALRQLIKIDCIDPKEVVYRVESKFNRTAFLGMIHYMLSEVISQDQRDEADGQEVKAEEGISECFEEGTPRYALRLFELFSLLEYSHLRSDESLPVHVYKEWIIFVREPTIQNLNGFVNEFEAEILVLEKKLFDLYDFEKQKEKLIVDYNNAKALVEKPENKTMISVQDQVLFLASEIEKLEKDIVSMGAPMEQYFNMLFNVLGLLFKESSLFFNVLILGSDPRVLEGLHRFIRNVICVASPVFPNPIDDFYYAMYCVMTYTTTERLESDFFKEKLEFLSNVICSPETCGIYNNKNCQKASAVAILRLFIDFPHLYGLMENKKLWAKAITVLLAKPNVKFASISLSILKKLSETYHEALDDLFDGESVALKIEFFSREARAHTENVLVMGGRDIVGAAFLSLLTSSDLPEKPLYHPRTLSESSASSSSTSASSSGEAASYSTAGVVMAAHEGCDDLEALRTHSPSMS